MFQNQLIKSNSNILNSKRVFLKKKRSNIKGRNYVSKKSN